MNKPNGIQRGLLLSVFLVAAVLLASTLAAAVDSGAARFGSISGLVLEARSGEPIPLVEIQIWNELGEYRETALTDMSGGFLIEGLVPGHYYATTMESGFLDELYSDRMCPISECDPTDGTPIEVSAGAMTVDVDFHLER